MDAMPDMTIKNYQQRTVTVLGPGGTARQVMRVSYNVGDVASHAVDYDVAHATTQQIVHDMQVYVADLRARFMAAQQISSGTATLLGTTVI